MSTPREDAKEALNRLFCHAHNIQIDGIGFPDVDIVVDCIIDAAVMKISEQMKSRNDSIKKLVRQI